MYNAVPILYLYYAIEQLDDIEILCFFKPFIYISNL